MANIEDLDGQQTAINAALERLNSRQKEIIIVSGPHGVGVTWAMQRAAERWETAGHVALNAAGEPLASDRRLFPWLTLALPGAKRLARLTMLKAGVAQGGRSIPVVGPVTSYILEELLNYHKMRLGA